MTTTNPSCIEPESSEDVVIWALIAFVGAVGIAVGLLLPERTLEPSLGVVMLLFVVVTAVSERRRRCKAAAND